LILLVKTHLAFFWKNSAVRLTAFSQKQRPFRISFHTNI
jgi:hypothetical protein